MTTNQQPEELEQRDFCINCDHIAMCHGENVLCGCLLREQPCDNYKVTPPPPVGEVEELRERIKSGALRPLADKFQQLARQIDSGDYELPKTIEEASVITEGYIDEVADRILALITGASGSLPTEPQTDAVTVELDIADDKSKAPELEGVELEDILLRMREYDRYYECNAIMPGAVRLDALPWEDGLKLIQALIATATRTAVEEARKTWEGKYACFNCDRPFAGDQLRRTYDEHGKTNGGVCTECLAALKEQKHE